MKRENQALASNLLFPINSKPHSGQALPNETEGDSMLRIAVPLMNNRVSPYFGCCDKLLLLDWDGGALRSTCQVLPADDPWHISRHLADIGVQKVVCGGIWSFHKNWLIAHGIEVIDNQHGEADEVVRWVRR